jgi:hypothetical protein
MPTETSAAATETAHACHEIDGRYFTIGPKLQPLVRRLQEGCSEAATRAEVEKLSRNQSGEARRYDTAQLAAFLDEVFAPFGLVIEQTSDDGESLWRLRSASTGVGRSSPESALRCRVTVLPETAARRAAGAMKCLYSGAGITFAGVFWLMAVTLYVKHFGAAGFSLDLLFTPLNQISAVSALTITLAILGASLFHEVGHCAAVSAFGARVGRIGFGIYWLSPAFFSDVSSAWTLGRWKRVVVDCGGIYFQLLACAIYAIAATILHSHNIQTALQTSIMVNLVSVLCSLDPMLKYDGYWIISDALDIPNLRRRSEGAVRDFMQSGSDRRAKHHLFLLAYAVLSILFTLLFLAVLALSIRHHVAEAVAFPARVWAVMRHDVELGRFGPEVSELGLALLRLIPVACAPVALVTAVSSMLGFLRRMTAPRPCGPP